VLFFFFIASVSDCQQASREGSNLSSRVVIASASEAISTCNTRDTLDCFVAEPSRSFC